MRNAYNFIYVAILLRLSACISQLGLLGQDELQGFTLTSVPSTSHLVIFGGISNDMESNSYLILATVGSGTNTDISSNIIEYDPSSGGPIPRYQHCATYNPDDQLLYIFGGKDSSNATLSDLWAYNTKIRQWKLIHDSEAVVEFDRCEITAMDGKLYVTGVDDKLKIYQFNLLYGSPWAVEPLNFISALSIYGKLWDGHFMMITTPYQYQGQNTDSTALKQTPLDVAPDQFCLVAHPHRPVLYLITQIAIYMHETVSKKMIQIGEMSPSDKSQLKCHVVEQNASSNWIFVSYYVQDRLTLEYYSMQDIKVMGNFDLKVIENDEDYEFSVLHQDIYVVNENLSLWVIQDECQPQGNVVDCFYDQIFCKEGWTGSTCTDSQCPNTLSLLDHHNHMQILYECSGNGKCQNGTCICEPLWEGDDCSTYRRHECFGELLANWPILNCECLEETIGGNSCQVKFCYNDCTNHGVCKSDGICACDTGYYGEDCSVNIIEFPDATRTIPPSQTSRSS